MLDTSECASRKRRSRSLSVHQPDRIPKAPRLARVPPGRLESGADRNPQLYGSAIPREVGEILHSADPPPCQRAAPYLPHDFRFHGSLPSTATTSPVLDAFSPDFDEEDRTAAMVTSPPLLHNSRLGRSANSSTISQSIAVAAGAMQEARQDSDDLTTGLTKMPVKRVSSREGPDVARPDFSSQVALAEHLQPSKGDEVGDSAKLLTRPEGMVKSDTAAVAGNIENATSANVENFKASAKCATPGVNGNALQHTALPRLSSGTHQKGAFTWDADASCGKLSHLQLAALHQLLLPRANAGQDVADMRSPNRSDGNHRSAKARRVVKRSKREGRNAFIKSGTTSMKDPSTSKLSSSASFAHLRRASSHLGHSGGPAALPSFLVPEIPALDPPITLQTLSELDLGRILQSKQLRQDIVFDENLTFKPDCTGNR